MLTLLWMTHPMDAMMVTLDEAMPYAELIAKAQACAQIWEWLLYSSGGALELWKCFWYLMYWQWVNGCPLWLQLFHVLVLLLSPLEMFLITQ